MKVGHCLLALALLAVPCIVESFSVPFRLPLSGTRDGSTVRSIRMSEAPHPGNPNLVDYMESTRRTLNFGPLPEKPTRRNLLSWIGGAAAFSLMPNFGVRAADQREIGEIPASGIIFKDTIKVTAFEDPKVKGVQLYISDFQRPITERLQKDFFSDPTQASVSCAKIGKVTLADNIYKGKEGEEVFEQARSLLFKTVRIRRIYDEQTNTLVYVSYSTRLNKEDDENKSRFKTTTCAININDQ